MDATATLKGARVETYNLIAARTNRHIRVATKVVLSDGRVIHFLDRMPKRDALRNAAYQIERGYLDR